MGGMGREVLFFLLALLEGWDSERAWEQWAKSGLGQGWTKTTHSTCYSCCLSHQKQPQERGCILFIL